MKMSDKFNEAFGLPDDEPKKTAIEVFQPPVENSEEDFQYARSNLYSAIEVSANALDDLAGLAKKAQNARVYEVLANLIRTTIDANKDLLNLQKTRKELQSGGIPGSEGPQTVNNNLFMTTAALQAMIAQQKKDSSDNS